MLSAVLIIGLQAQAMGQPRSRLFWVAWYGWLLIYFTAQLLPHLPGMEPLRDFGLAMYAGLEMWLIGCISLVLTRRNTAKLQTDSRLMAKTAA
jgi:hypothetical protein